MIIIDANYILRWFLNDQPAQAHTVNDLLEGAEPSSVFIDRVTIAEISYVLRSRGYDHKQIFRLFDELACYPGVSPYGEVEAAALSVYRRTNLDFEDCVLIAYHQVNQYQIGSFDKNLIKHCHQK